MYLTIVHSTNLQGCLAKAADYLTIKISDFGRTSKTSKDRGFGCFPVCGKRSVETAINGSPLYFV